nr:hypothetical protein [Tanacetum cinerariifolium]
MKRVGKGFSGRDTPLFLTMLVQAQVDMGEGSTIQSSPQHTQTIIQPTTSKTLNKQKPRKPRRQDPKETQPSGPITNVVDKALNEKILPTQSNDPPLSRVNILGKKSLGEEDASKQGRNIADIDVDAEITLVDETVEDQGRFDDQEMFYTYVLNDEEVVVEDVNATSIATAVTTAATTVDSINDITLAQELVEIKTSKPKARRIIMQEPSETPTTTTIPISSKKKNLSRLKMKIWLGIIQAMMDADYELAASSKRAGDELDQERSKKKKVEDDKESKDLKRCLEIISDDGDDVTIDVTPLSIKTLIIDYKIYKEGKRSYF